MAMIISLIVAVDENKGIGLEGSIPWRLSADMKRFKEVTMGHHIIMGRKTYESIGKPLPGRTTVIITHNKDYQPEGTYVVQSIGEALAFVKERGENEAVIIGGGEIFAQTIDIADRLYLTKVHTQVPCDVFFPEINLDDWDEVKREWFSADEKNQHSFEILLLERKDAALDKSQL